MALNLPKVSRINGRNRTRSRIWSPGLIHLTTGSQLTFKTKPVQEGTREPDVVVNAQGGHLVTGASLMHALTTDYRLGADRSEGTRRTFPFFHLGKQSRGLQKAILGSCCFVCLFAFVHVHVYPLVISALTLLLRKLIFWEQVSLEPEAHWWVGQWVLDPPVSILSIIPVLGVTATVGGCWEMQAHQAFYPLSHLTSWTWGTVNSGDGCETAWINLGQQVCA